jgi:RNA polymerase sigma-70 factor, ECF subfamily
MNIAALKAELEQLHEASFGWAMSCCRRNREEAAEVLQIVYLKILEGKAHFRGESTLQTWLFAVIRKTAISERRKTLIRSPTMLAGAKSETSRSHFGAGPEAKLERSETQKRFQLALERLPARQRETLHLVFYQDLSLREAAAVMGISIGSARRHYERGKKHLRRVLDNEELDYGVTWGRKQNPSTVL